MKTIGKLTAFSLSLFLLGGCFLLTFISSNDMKEIIKAEDFQQTALTEAYYILLVLQHPLHGYGMMQEIERLTKGRLQLGPGTLYGALGKLTQKGWIRQSGQVQEKGKKEYTLTFEGRVVLAREIERLKELLESAETYGRKDYEKV